MIADIEQKELFTSYDPVKRLFFISYPAAVTPAMIAQVYGRLHQALHELPAIEGIVFDFQHIQRLDETHLAAIEQHSSALNAAHDLQHRPLVLVVQNSRQPRMVEDVIVRLPPACPWQIVQSVNEVFPFIHTFRTDHHLPLNDAKDPLILNTDKVSCWYDNASRVSYFVYYGVVDPNVTADVYEYIGGIFQSHGVGIAQGGLYDFRHVTEFQNANLNTVRRTSGALNTNYDMSGIAVGLVVSNILQERMVLLAMKVTPQEKRKKIVYGYQEGLEFIRTFHARRTDTLEQIK